MFGILCQILVYVFIVQAFSTDDFSNELTKEMIEDGKNQYQLLQERGKLPRYGNCWTSAVEHIHEGCRYLTEDVQSDIALRITNCFLEMSGHETYNCDLDKKPNLRGICINSMTDRAFNVYTEFYTHAQNICWFLRGQVWQEKISERTFKVGEQLKTSLSQQTDLLKQQQESLTMQTQLLKYGKNLESILNASRKQAEHVMEEIRLSTARHQQLLSLMTNSLSGLQSWLIGEISWFDSLVFYISGAIIIAVITSTPRTASARLPLLFTLSMNIVFERIICDQTGHTDDGLIGEVHQLHQNLYKYIWWCRQFTVTTCILITLVQIYFYRDYVVANNMLLLKIQEQNKSIREELEKIRSPFTVRNCAEDKFNIVRESPYSRRSIETEIIKPVVSDYYNNNSSSNKKSSDTNSDISKNSLSTTQSSFIESPIEAATKYSFTSKRFFNIRSVSSSRDGFDFTSPKSTDNQNVSTTSVTSTSTARRYNLRQRPDTPVHT